MERATPCHWDAELGRQFSQRGRFLRATGVTCAIVLQLQHLPELLLLQLPCIVQVPQGVLLQRFSFYGVPYLKVTGLLRCATLLVLPIAISNVDKTVSCVASIVALEHVR